MNWSAPVLIIAALALAWAVTILLLGAGRFGRAGSQGFIDRLEPRAPWLAAILNRYHTEIRASFHYIEFMTLTLFLYLLFSKLSPSFKPIPALAAWILASAFAWLDEFRQSLTPGRNFRRVDFFHSLLGAELMALLIFVYYQIQKLLA